MKLLKRPWLSMSNLSPAKTILLADDKLKADEFYQAASQGSAFVWQGDFQNAKQLLMAVDRRIAKQAKGKKTKAASSVAEAFHRHRQGKAHRAQLLSRLLIPVEKDFTISLKRAPDVKLAIEEAVDQFPGACLVSLKDLLGFIGAHEWRKKGVPIPTLGQRIYPYYGTFSPVRGEYLDLVARAQLPEKLDVAFDIGTGTGVIAALLAKRGVKKIIATESDPRAVACAKENIQKLAFKNQVTIENKDMFPNGKADLIVCNPPWVPAKATSNIERAIYDEDSKMLKSFLAGVGEHLTEKGEAWLILSDLAEHLGLRSGEEVAGLIAKANLQVIETLSVTPVHPKSKDITDTLFAARSKEQTQLFRLQNIK